jgi:hypothetical protein
MYTCRRGLSLIYLVEYSEVSASCSRDKAVRDLGDDYGSAKTKVCKSCGVPDGSTTQK